MQDVLECLLSRGFSLQLLHEQDEVQNGFVTLIHSSGQRLAHAPKIQIMFRGNRQGLVEGFVDECLRNYQKIVQEDVGADEGGPSPQT